MHRPIPTNTPGFARMARPGELPADLVQQAEAAVREAQARGGDPAAPRFTEEVAVGSLAPGVIAMVTRAGSHVTLAFSEQALNDALFVAVDRLRSEDVAARPEIAGSHALMVMADHSVKAVEGGSEEVFPHPLYIPSRGGGDPIAARILEEIRSEAPTHRAGIGTVRIVRATPDVL